MSVTANSLQLEAQAVRAKRRREGAWRGRVVAHTEYQTRPLDWIVDKLGIPRNTIQWSLNPGYNEVCPCDRCAEADHVGPHLWDGDPDPLVMAMEALANGESCGIESATGTGKTFIAACITLWWLACFPKSIVSQWAPKEDQLLDNMWKEIGSLFPRFKQHFPHAELLSGKLRMMPADEGGEEVWAATANVAAVAADEESSTRAQGIHAEHLLIITEETPGMHPAIMKSLFNTRTDDHNLHLALGNPDHRKDELHKLCQQESVVAVRASAYDHPNIVSKLRVVPGAIGEKRLKDRIKILGRGTRLYNSRIRGISPSESSEALIKWEWCIMAANRYEDMELRRGKLALGADVANSKNGDKAAISRWQGSCLTEVVDFPCPDASVLAVDLIEEMRANKIDPRHVGVDPIGVGASTVNKMREYGIRVRHLGGGNKAVPEVDKDILWSETEPDLEGNIKSAGPRVPDAQRYRNLRDQMYWRMREDLRLGRVAFPYDEALFEDLTTPEYETKNGKIQVESKEDIIKRIGHSPNKGDAVVYGNFVRSRLPVEEVTEEEEQDPNRDYGLERIIDRTNRQRLKEHRRMMRQLKRLARKSRGAR